MKTEISTEKQKFNPVSLKLTFETPEELNAFATLFNHSGIVDTLTEVFNIGPRFDHLSQDLEEAGANTSDKLDEMAETLTEKLEYYSEK